MPDSFSSAWTVSKPATSGPFGIVVAQSRRAAAVGAAVLEAGGNAVDAAVATSFALGAVEPWMSGLGGAGCMLVWPAGEARPIAVDAGMSAPQALDPRDYPLAEGHGAGGDLFGWPAVLEDRNLRGPLSVCAPTLLGGIALAHDRWGTMPWAGLVAPAVEFAKAGLEVDWFASLIVTGSARELARDPAAREVWLPDGLPPAVPFAGEPGRLPLGRLPDTLATIASEGPLAFGRGEVGHALVADVRAAGGRLAPEDLPLPEPRAVRPLEVPYRDGTVFAVPGPFAGEALERCLGLLAGRDLGPGPGPAAYLAYADALRLAYEERLASAGTAEGAAPACTSHFCVVDRAGTLVAVTQTLLSLFGSKVLSPSTGILLNNGVMWFDPRPGRPNSMAPGRRPLANMCPAAGERDRAGGRERFALGASGGRRILPAVLQLASFLLDHGLDLGAALHAPRIDASGGEQVTANPALGAAALAALVERFPTLEAAPSVFPSVYACPSGVLRELATGTNHGAAEPVHPWAGAVGERA